MKRTRANMLLDSLKSPRTPFNEFRQRVLSIETVWFLFDPPKSLPGINHGLGDPTTW
jgi:hypothetical protein